LQIVFGADFGAGTRKVTSLTASSRRCRNFLLETKAKEKEEETEAEILSVAPEVVASLGRVDGDPSLAADCASHSDCPRPDSARILWYRWLTGIVDSSIGQIPVLQPGVFVSY
jgi:hypothetical protein